MYFAILTARCGRADACRLLLEAGSSHATADIASWTPLLWTCYKGTSVETADVLIRHGADVNAVGIHHISGSSDGDHNHGSHSALDLRGNPMHTYFEGHHNFKRASYTMFQF